MEFKSGPDANGGSIKRWKWIEEEGNGIWAPIPTDVVVVVALVALVPVVGREKIKKIKFGQKNLRQWPKRRRKRRKRRSREQLLLLSVLLLLLLLMG